MAFVLDGRVQNWIALADVQCFNLQFRICFILNVYTFTFWKLFNDRQESAPGAFIGVQLIMFFNLRDRFRQVSATYVDSRPLHIISDINWDLSAFLNGHFSEGKQVLNFLKSKWEKYYKNLTIPFLTARLFSSVLERKLKVDHFSFYSYFLSALDFRSLATIS